MKTLIVIIMDESGSMSSRKDDVIVGFNQFLNDQQEIKADTASAIFVKFNTVVSIQNDCTPIEEVPALTRRSYKPAGNTALFDAIWEGVRLGEKKEAEFDRVLCIIMTDGEENSSRMITSAGIRNVMKTKEDAGKWTFVYIGENPEHWAARTGTSAGNVIAYEHNDPIQNFRSVQMAANSYRSVSQIQQLQLMQNIPTMCNDTPPHYSQIVVKPKDS